MAWSELPFLAQSEAWCPHHPQNSISPCQDTGKLKPGGQIFPNPLGKHAAGRKAYQNHHRINRYLRKNRIITSSSSAWGKLSDPASSISPYQTYLLMLSSHTSCFPNPKSSHSLDTETRRKGEKNIFILPVPRAGCGNLTLKMTLHSTGAA